MDGTEDTTLEGEVIASAGEPITTDPVDVEDMLTDDITALLLEDGDPTEKAAIEAGNMVDGEELTPEEDDFSDDLAEIINPSELIDPETGLPMGDKAEEKKDPEADPEEKTEEPAEPEAERDVDEDGQPLPKSDKAQARIRQLIEQRNQEKQRAEEALARAEAAERQAVEASPEHPDPDKELEAIDNQYRNLKTPQEVVASGGINPLTGAPYTLVEAQAAITEFKLDLQQKRQEVEQVRVENMTRARQAEQIANTLAEPLVDLIHDHPELDSDPKNEKCNESLCNLLQSHIDAHTIKERGLLVGYTKEPEEIVAEFRKTIESLSAIKVNKQKKTDKKIDRIPGRAAAQAPRSADANEGEKTSEEELFSAFDDAMKNLVV